MDMAAFEHARPAEGEGVGACYDGGADPDAVADVELGVKEGSFHSSYLVWVAMSWAVGGP